MIVRTDGADMFLITQPDHAAMAGQVMTHCAPLTGHPRRPSILHACAEHDGGWIEIDAAPRVDPSTRRIIDFMTAPAAVKQAVWPRAIARLGNDPKAAALVAQHAITVYARYAADPEWRGFFDEMAASRDALLIAADYSLADLEGDYPFVRLADLVSLTFCNQWIGPQSFGGWTVRGEGSRVVVTPDAFAGLSVNFEITARRIAARGFDSDRQLLDALSGAESIQLRGSVG